MPTFPRNARLAILATLLVAAVVCAVLFPVQNWIVDLLEAIRRLGWWGPVAVAGLYVIANLLAIPGLFLTLGAGALFGVLGAVLCVAIGSTLGAVAAFVVGRTVARGWVERVIAGNPRLQAVDAAVAQNGFKVVLLTRLSPLFPYNLLNFSYGATRVSLRDYALGSALGMLPTTVTYSYLGSTLKNLADVAAGRAAPGPLQQAFFVVGLLATVVATVYVTRLARRELVSAVSLDDQPAVMARS